MALEGSWADSQPGGRPPPGAGAGAAIGAGAAGGVHCVSLARNSQGNFENSMLHGDDSPENIIVC